MRCPACAEDNPEGARFCNACGASLSSISADRLQSLRGFIPADVAEKMMAVGGLGERRIVTALYCDVVGSTTLGERLGPERFKVVIDQLLGRIIMAVAHYEGTVAQVMGDGLLAFFGAPLAHEDDPERAVRAALDIRDAVSASGRELEAAYGVSIQVRVGINTGPVVLSRIVDVLEVAYNALGDTVTTAVRLQGAAAPGAILASEAAVRLIEPLFEIRRLGSLTLKGKAESVPTIQILRRSTLTGKPRGIGGLTSPIVGRDRELALLQESIQAVTEGRGQIVSVIGEAGIGKSRLVAEEQRLNPRVLWLEGRCLSYAGSIPYFPFLDLLREWLGVTSADPEAKVRIELRAALDRAFGDRADEVYPYLGSMLRLTLEPQAAGRIADLSAESLQHQVFKVMREWVRRVAAEQPLGLILDDLHWGDGTSLILLENLLEVTEEAPALFCLLFRPEREHGCWRVNDLAGQRFPHRYVEIVLQPLTPAHAEQLVTNLLTLPDFPEDVRDVILEKAEGNPFFVEEVIRELIEAGILTREGDRWHATRRVTALDVPDNVEGVLLSRVDRLPEEAKRVLQAASVIGRLFPVDILKRMVDMDGRVDAALVELQRHGLIVERRRIPQAEYRFKHALTQEVAYSTLVEGERRRFHLKVAQTLEAQYIGRQEEVYGLLAYHYDQSEEQGQALHFLVRAGDKSRAEYADEEALQYYARAVDLMKRRGEWQAAAQTLMKAALAHHIAFDFKAANLAYREAFEILNWLKPAVASPLPPARLRMGISEPVSIDTARTSQVSTHFLAHQVFEGLLHFAPEMNVMPGLAQSWEISVDGTRYLFHLRRGWKWSDGHPVTAHDFVFAWLRSMRGVNSHLFFDIVGAKKYSEGKIEDKAAVGVHALEDHTLEVILEGPRAYFPFILAHSVTLPQPRGAIEQYGDEWTAMEHLVTNGSYLIAEWHRGSYLRLVVNPYNPGRGGNVKEVRLIFQDSSNPALFENREVDVQTLAVLDDVHATRLRESLHIAPPIGCFYIFFRCDRPPFNDRRLRLAFAHATDRRSLARAGGLGSVPADGGFVPPPIPGHSPHIAMPFDPKLAQHFLREAGYPNGRGLGPFTVLVPQGTRIASQVPVETWQEVLGVQVTVRAVPTVEYFQSLGDSENPIGRAGWISSVPDPDYCLRIVFHSTSINNKAHWTNETFDGLVEEAQASTEQRRRMALYHDADRLLVAEEAAIIPTVYSGNVTLLRPEVRQWWSIAGYVFPADILIEREL